MSIVLIPLAVICSFYYIFPVVRNIWGEIIIKRVLMSINKENYRVLANLKVHSENSSFKIDYIIVSVYGIFIIKKVNIIRRFSTINGDESSWNWLQTVYPRFMLPLASFEYKQRMSNPIVKLKAQTELLKHLLENDFSNLVFNPIVVLTSKPIAIEIPDVKTCVTYFSSLNKIIKEYDKQVFQVSKVKDIYSQLSKNKKVVETGIQKEIMEKH